MFIEEKENKQIIYSELKRYIHEVQRRYQDAMIVIAGDFNDHATPKKLNEIKRVDGEWKYSRINFKEEENTMVDYIYCNQNIFIS